jgi:hypothetical protein
MPVERRCTGALPISRSGRGAALAPCARTLPPARPARRSPLARGRASSISVFHSPHSGHCPCHCALRAPQEEQVWIVSRAT